jgi:hypothetical protein
VQNYIEIREGDLLAWVLVTPLANGKWESFVFLEMRATHTDETAPVIKRRLPQQFDDEEEAETTASAFALRSMRRHASEITLLLNLRARLRPVQLPAPVA